MSEKEVKKTTIGGQALIEGIYMRGPSAACIAVRKENGEIDISDRTPPERKGILKLPLIRGVIGLYDSMKDGISALNYSADIFAETEEEEEPSRFEKWLIDRFGEKSINDFIMTSAVVLGCIVPVVLFFLLPTLIAGLFDDAIGGGVVRNLVEGLIRIMIFLGFLYFVSRQKDIKRTFMYHGAEHKTIACYEKGLPLTVENAAKQTRFHPRCGTSFLFVVMIVSIIVLSLFTWRNVWMRFLLRLLMLPVIVAVSYEINRFAGRHDNAFTMAIRAPGLALQRLTTVEPDDSMLEVAIAALSRVIPEDSESDKW